MFGTFRFALALLVVVTHLSHWIWPGIYAVFGFYLLSGYLMCLVLNQRYGFSLAGFGAYCTNRFLRIYPPYWFACALSAALLMTVGQPAAAVFWGPWQLPTTAMDWIDNIGIASLPMGDMNRLVPPSWALRVEIFYYAIIGLGLGRSRRLAIAWVAASLAYHGYLAYTHAGWEARYFPVAAASLPFSLGALLYHCRETLGARLRGSGALLGLAVAVWSANLALAPMALGSVMGPLRFYLNLICVSLIAASLCLREAPTARLGAADARLGDLAYPVYLVHMQVGLAISTLGIVPASPNPMLIVVSLLPVLFASWLTLRLVGDPIETLRRRVRDRLRSRGASESSV